MNSRRIIGCTTDENSDSVLVYADGSKWFLCGDLGYADVSELGIDIENLINEKELERQTWIERYFNLKREIMQLHNYEKENEKLKEEIEYLKFELKLKDAEIDEHGNLVLKEKNDGADNLC